MTWRVVAIVAAMALVACARPNPRIVYLNRLADSMNGTEHRCLYYNDVAAEINDLRDPGSAEWDYDTRVWDRWDALYWRCKANEYK